MRIIQIVSRDHHKELRYIGKFADLLRHLQAMTYDENLREPSETTLILDLDETLIATAVSHN